MKNVKHKNPTVAIGKYMIFDVGNAENVNPIEFYKAAYIEKQIEMYWAITPNLKKEFCKKDLEVYKSKLGKILEKSSMADWEKFYSENSNAEIKSNYLSLLKANEKAEQQKLLKGQNISSSELFILIMNAYQALGLKFSQYTFSQSQKESDPTDLADLTHFKDDGTAITNGESELSGGKPKPEFENTPDITEINNSDDKMESLFSQLKVVDLVIVSSGVSELNQELDWEIENKVIKTNVNGIAKVYEFMFSKLKKQGHGHLVGISSIASLRGNRYCPSYSASKAFQANYLEALRCIAKNEKLNLKITDVQTGFVDTPMAKGEGLFWVAP